MISGAVDQYIFHASLWIKACLFSTYIALGVNSELQLPAFPSRLCASYGGIRLRFLLLRIRLVSWWSARLALLSRCFRLFRRTRSAGRGNWDSVEFVPSHPVKFKNADPNKYDTELQVQVLRCNRLHYETVERNRRIQHLCIYQTRVHAEWQARNQHSNNTKKPRTHLRGHQTVGERKPDPIDTTTNTPR